MARERTEHDFSTAKIRRTSTGAAANLFNIQGLRLFVYPDGRVNLVGINGRYVFESTTEFAAALMGLLRRMEVQARQNQKQE